MLTALRIGASAMMSRRRAASGVATYVVTGFTDADYFAGVSAQGRAALGTVRLVAKLLSVPTNATKIVAGRCDNGGGTRGWYLGTGVGGTATIVLMAAGCGAKASPAFTVSASDIGSLFVLHGTIDAAAVRLFVNGVQIGSGTATGSLCTPALDAEFMTIGRHRPTGFSTPDIGVVALHGSRPVMDAAAIAADADVIIARTSRLVFPTLPGEDVAYLASDLVSVTDWHDRAGDDATLTRIGSPTLTEVT